MDRKDLENNRVKINVRKGLQNLFLLFFAFGLLLGMQANSFAQKKPRIKDVLLFEIEKSRNPGSAGGRRLSSSRIIYIYKSGRIACRLVGYDPRGKELKFNRSRCSQISKEKIGELTALAEQTDFREAKYAYKFFKGGVDFGNSFSITYFGKNARQEILLTNPRIAQNDSPLPESLTAFLKKIAEIDEAMEVEYEF